MKATPIAPKSRAQIHPFSGIFSPHFSKPKARFLEPMRFGLSASQDCKLSQVARVLGEDLALKKTEERLSHHLAEPALGPTVQPHLVQHAARRVSQETCRVIAPTAIRKPYAQARPHLATVRDGSIGELVSGYWSGGVLACAPQSRRVRPLLQQLWSAEAPDFVSEECPGAGAGAPDGRGHAGLGPLRDGPGRRSVPALRPPVKNRGLRVIRRLTGQRHLVVRGRSRLARDWPARCGCVTPRRRCARPPAASERATGNTAFAPGTCPGGRGGN